MLPKVLEKHSFSAGEKLLWFQSQLDPEKPEYTKHDACEIIERYDKPQANMSLTYDTVFGVY